ncbi:DUF6716 putative glycosyltransferase [Streptomyces hainanensis]|uniref:Uncharacterized protein n=1 Tax=Streptomyces hainanensis TaxID=402648 RepID=A0A4R4SII7_9ACTN|nr:DUF6716 putative glycosyltransferase [Streptomyces hainanensis]TDC63311.1 hypothetical protein E1283_32610 [Streptomyces hainanensis]
MPDSSRGPLRLAVLADSDTRWKWGALTARRIAPESSVHGYLLRGRATPTARQLAETDTGVEEPEEITAINFLRRIGDLQENNAESAAKSRDNAADDAPYDALILACVGGTVQAMLHGLARAWHGAPRRTVVVSGYVGVVYEKLTDGLLLRHGADIVLANSAFDAARFREQFRGVRADTSAVTECALPFLAGQPYDAGAVERGDRPYRLVFAVQPSVPGTRKDRAYLLERAVEHARRHPEREVVLKLRSKPGEHTTHIEELPYQRLVERIKGGTPANFQLAYGNMGEVLDGTDLLVTVSSTAALESLHRGIPTAVLTDLGIREQHGNHYFLGSGCYASWDELDGGLVPTPDPGWLADQGLGRAPEEAFGPAHQRLATLLEQADVDEGLPPLDPYYTVRTAPGYLPGVLARHGLDVKGEPLVGFQGGPDPTTGMRGASKRLLRSTARGAYRAGVQRVAPLIRRWGQL